VTPPRGTFTITFLLSQECAEALDDARQHLAGGPLARSGEDHTQPGQKPVPVRSREQKFLLAPEVVVDEPLATPAASAMSFVVVFSKPFSANRPSSVSINCFRRCSACLLRLVDGSITLLTGCSFNLPKFAV
jgi:hypothetical protein